MKRLSAMEAARDPKTAKVLVASFLKEREKQDKAKVLIIEKQGKAKALIATFLKGRDEQIRAKALASGISQTRREK